MLSAVATKLATLLLLLLSASNVAGDSHSGSISHQEEANERANAGALKAIQWVPRFGGDSEMNAEDITSASSPMAWLDFGGERNDYWVGILSLIAFPMVFVGLSVLVAPFWIVCRCAKCCCCRKKEPKREVTSCRIYSPFLLVLSCTIAIIAMAAIAYGANVDFSGALLENDGEGENGNLFEMAETLMIDASAKMTTISGITTELREGMASTLFSVEEILNDTSILSVGSWSLLSMLGNISALWSDYNVTSEYEGEQYSFDCAFCSTFGGRLSNISEEIEAQLGPVFDDLDDTVAEIEDSLVSAEANITDEMDLFVDTVGDFRQKVVDAEHEVTRSRDEVETHNGHRELAYNIVFAVPLISTVYLLFGGVLKKPLCFTVAYCYLWFSCTMMWALLAVHLPVAVLLDDACDFLDVVEQNVTDTINGTVGEVVEACLTDERLTDVLGLSAFLNFTNLIEFPSMGNLSDSFHFEQLDAFEGDALSTNFTTFYAKGDAALLTINNLTASSPAADGVHWDRTNVAELSPSAYFAADSTPWDTLDGLKDLLMAENASISAFADTLDRIRANLSSVDEQASWLQQNVQDLANSVGDAKDQLQPLFDAVGDLEETATCGFVGEAYYDTKAVMCSAVLGSLSRIVVAMFVIAILSMVSCLWTIPLVRRVEWWQRQKKQEKDDKLQQSMQPKKPSIILMQHPSGYQQPGYGYNGPQI